MDFRDSSYKVADLHGLLLYFHFVKLRIKSQMEYRISFIMEVLSQFCITVVDFLAIVLLFARFRHLAHWDMWEVGFLYGMMGISFSLAMMLPRGFDTFQDLVVRGEFDNMLIRPLGTFYQVFAYQFHLRRLGGLAQALIIFIVANSHLEISWTVGKVIFFIAATVGGSCFFMGLMVIGATTCFWTVQSIEIINIFTHGGTVMGSYPISIYRYWFRHFFTFVVPLAFVNYFPSLVLLEKPDPNGAPYILSQIAPAVGVLFLLISTAFWRFGVKHYQSTGH